MDQRWRLDALPDKLLAMVAAGLDAISLGKAACACRALARICMDPRPWRALCATLGASSAPLYAPVVRGEVVVAPDPGDRWRWLCVLATVGADRRVPWHGGTLGGSRERAPGLPAVRACSVHGWFDAARRIQGFGVEAVDHLSAPDENMRWYAGTWEDGLWHGHGVRRTHDGTMTCQWRRGAAHGHGESVTVSGRCSYVGAWKGGARHGRGVATCCISHTQCTGGWVAGRGQGWCVFSKLDGQTGAGRGLCYECDFTWWTTIDWLVLSDPRVRSVGLWCRNDRDTGKRTRIEYADGSVFEAPCRAPSAPYTAMPTGRGTLTLADGTRLACDAWNRGSPTGTITRTRSGSPLACAEWWNGRDFYGCDLVCCVDGTLGSVSRDTAILSKRAVYETRRICLEKPCATGAVDPAASLPWSGSRSPINVIYYPEPARAPSDFVRFVRLLAARLLPWTDAMVDYALGPAGPLALDGGPLFAQALKEPVGRPLPQGTHTPGPGETLCRLTRTSVPVAECIITRGGSVMWDRAAKAWLRTLGRCMGVDEQPPPPHWSTFPECRVLRFDPAWTAAGLAPTEVAYVAKRSFGAIRNVYAPVERRLYDGIDWYDVGAAWHAMVTAVLVADCRARAATPYDHFERAMGIAGGRSGFHAAALAGVDIVGAHFAEGTSFCASVFTQCRFFGCTFERCLYVGAQFVDCVFVDCTVGGVPDAVLGGPHGRVTGNVSVVARATARYGASFVTLFPV